MIEVALAFQIFKERFVYLFERESWRKRERDKEQFFINGEAWVSPKPAIRRFFWVSHVIEGAKHLGQHPLLLSQVHW